MQFFADQQCKLIDFLASKLSLSKNKVKSIIDRKKVFVNDKIVWIASYTLKPNDKIFVLPENDQNKTFEIIFEDQNFIIVNKGCNLVVNESFDSLENKVRKMYGNDVMALHRIDKDTTGVVVFAKNMQVFEKMKKQWDKVEKTYYCISIGEANFWFKEIDYPVFNKTALSTVVLVSKNNGLSLFKVRTFTGRKHQIRIHLSKMGYPILGDYVYGRKINNIKVPRQMLHAYKIEFNFEGKKIFAVAQLPDDMKKIIKKYGL